jgi:ribosomal protein L11 methyltransferase
LADYPALEIEFRLPRDASLPDRLYALLDDFEPAAIHEDESGDRWRVFFRSPERRDAASAAISSTIDRRLLHSAPLDVPDEDWARRSQDGLRAIEAGGLIIAPPWDVPNVKAEGRRQKAEGTRQQADLPVIIIEPSTGFGTGHHATTRLCLRALRRLELRGARVVDIGTGSGVLALAAWKLGAADVVAIDNDPDALDNARDNIARNGAGASIDIIRDDLESLRIQRADIVLANLTGAVLVRFASELRGLAVEGGYLILSGFSPDDIPVILRAFTGLVLVVQQFEGDWAAVILRSARL